MMKAKFHQHNKAPIEVFVCEKHDDGTVSLSKTEKGGVFIRCAVSDKPFVGRATLVDDKKPAPKP